MLKIVDLFECDLGSIKPERKERFLRDAAAYTVGGEHPLPELIVTVAATHAGFMTRNKAFYRPDVMRAHLNSFLEPFPKPVQVHHSDHTDPVGRVRAVRYVDISNKYKNPLRDFKNQFNGKTFLDGKTNNENAFDQVKWILKNLQSTKDYQGLGYGELDLHISEKKAAEKILDERYLTVSVGFSTTEAYCSHCKQDWAGSDGPCEHRPGEMYDEVPMVLIPSNFLYEEVSWVNSPADPHAQVLRVLKTGTPVLETVSMPDAQNHDSAIVPILLGVSGEGIYRLDSYKEVEEARVQEILKVAKKKDSAQPELIEVDGAQFPKAAEILLANDAKRENWITDAVKAGKIPSHKHRVMIDPATGNGYADYVASHSHSVVNRVVQDNECYHYAEPGDEDKEEVNPDVHDHTLDSKVEPLTDAVVEINDTELCEACITKRKDNADAELCDACKEAYATRSAGGSMSSPSKKKKKAKKYNSDEFIELEEDAEIPDGYELVKEIPEFTEDSFALEDFYEVFVLPELDVIGATDAKLSAEQRKGMKSSMFCGPNRSFPVPDCAHVTAARRLIGRFKGNKSGILACVNRKAKALGCDKSKDTFEPIDMALMDPKGEDKEIKVRISDADDFQVVVHTIGTEVFEANKDKLYEVGKLLGMTSDQVDSFIKGQPDEAPLDQVVESLETRGSLELNELFADNLVAHINTMSEEARTDFVQKLQTKLIEAGFLPNYDDEYNELVEEVQSLTEKIARVTVANRDLYVAKQTLLAETIVHLKESLRKPGFEDLSEEARTSKITELTVRSIDSLNDSLHDVTLEIAGAKATQPELDADATGQPGSLELTEPDDKPVRDAAKVPFDPLAVRDMDDSTYQLARRLHSAFEGTSRNK